MYKFLHTIIPFAILLSPNVKADILFEGIFKVERDKAHIGYVIQRSEWNPQNKRRTLTSFIHTKSDTGENVTEVTRSISNEDFLPISSSFTSNSAGMNEVIRASFSAGKKTKVETFYDKNKKPERTDWLSASKESFLSSFLFYVVDLAKLTTSKDEAYEAFSEEDGRYSFGKVRLISNRTENGQKILQVVDDFAGEAIESFLFTNGDPLGARSDFNKTVTYLSTRAEATKGFDFPQRELIELFGDLPEGNKNLGEGLNAFKAIQAFELPKADRSVNSEETPVLTIKVPVHRDK